MYQSERTTLEMQHSSRFRTIERQDSFDLSCEPAIRCGRAGSVRVVRPLPRTQSLDLSNHVLETDLSSSMERNSHLAFSTPSDIFRSCASAAQTSVDSPLEPKIEDEGTSELTNGSRSPGFKEGGAAVENIGPLADEVGAGDASAAESKSSCAVSEKQEAPPEPSDQGSGSSAAVSEGDSGIDPSVEGAEEDGGGPAAAERRAGDASPRAQPQGKRKGEVFLNGVFLCVVALCMF